MKRSPLLILSIVLPMLISVFQPSPAEGQTRLKVGYSSLTGGSSPVWVAVEERLFNKYGIQAEGIYIPGSSVEIAALTAGEISLGIGGATAAMQMRLAGQPTIVIANAVKKLTYYLIASPAIRTPQDPSEIDPRAKGQDASFFYTNRIIDRLEKEGFFDEIRARYKVE